MVLSVWVATQIRVDGGQRPRMGREGRGEDPLLPQNQAKFSLSNRELTKLFSVNCSSNAHTEQDIDVTNKLSLFDNL